MFDDYTILACITAVSGLLLGAILSRFFNEGKVILVSIEGNISSGKSTLIKILKEKTKNNKQFMIIDEPIDVWENIKDKSGKSIIQAFYDNQKEMSFTFQICALFTRYESLNEIYENALLKSSLIGAPVIVLIERTVLTDYHIFAKMLRKAGNITEFEMMTYEMWFNKFSEKFKLEKSVYLKVEPEICLKRVCERNRNGEDKISIEYLRDCHEQHEEFYNDVLSKSNCVVIDNSKDKNTSDYEKNVETILSHFM